MEINIVTEPTTQLVPAQVDPKPVEGAPAPAELTAEQLADQKSKMMQVMGFEPMTEETKQLEADKHKPKPPVVVAPVVEKPAEEIKPPVVPPVQPPAPRRPRFDADELAKKTADEIERRQVQPPVTPPPAQAQFQMSAVDSHDNEVLALMERRGLVDKGTAEKHRAFVKSLAEYQAKWLKDHPGEEFDADAADHSAFYDANEPKFDSAKFTEAEKALEFEKQYAARPRETDVQRDEQIKSLLFDNRMEKLKPIIKTQAADCIARLIKDIDPEAFAIVSDANGLLDVNQGTLAKLKQFDSHLTGYIIESAKIVDACVEEICKFSDRELSKLDYKLRPESSEIHAIIAEVAGNAEQLMMSAPAETRLVNGREFVRSSKWNELIDQASNSPEKRAEVFRKYWTFTPDDLKKLVVGAEAGKVKDKIAELEHFNASRSKRGAAQPPKPAAGDTTRTATEPPPTRDRIAPPSLASSADVVTTTPPGGKIEKSFGETAISVAF